MTHPHIAKNILLFSSIWILLRAIHSFTQSAYKIGQHATFTTLSVNKTRVMKKLKKALMVTPIFVLPYFWQQMTLHTVGWNLRNGFVIQQIQPKDITKPIGYCYRSFTDEKKQYDTAQCECSAKVWAVLLLRLHSKADCFNIRTDHNELVSIQNVLDSIRQLAWWNLHLSEFDFKAVCHADAKLPVTYATSEYITYGDDKSLDKEDIFFLLISSSSKKPSKNNKNISEKHLL